MITFTYPTPGEPQTPYNDVIKCGDLHATLLKQQGELVTSRTNFWGVNGVSEIVSPGVATEIIQISAWINDATFVGDKDGADLLFAYLKYLDGLRGINGTVTQSGATLNLHNTYYNCTFEGYEPIALPGQDGPDFSQLCCGEWVLAVNLTWTTLRAHS